MTRLLLGLCLSLALPGVAVATTFMDTKEKDPLVAGARCVTPSIVSWGSYVYQWPSKYDAVFSPWIDPSQMWWCPNSGFVSLSSDFETMTPDQRARVADWLKAHPAKVAKLDLPDRLDRMEAIYQVRGMDDAFWARFYRIRALYSDNVQEADRWRAKALPLVQAGLARTDLTSFERMQGLYVVGYYAWRAGDHASAKASFEAMDRMDWTDKDATRAEALGYFHPLIANIEAGKLDGICGQVLLEPKTCPLVVEEQSAEAR